MKTAYELACERFIMPKYPKAPEEDDNPLGFDFIELDDFSNIEGKKKKPEDVLMANEYLQDVQDIYDYVDLELERIKKQDPPKETKAELDGFKIEVNKAVEQKAETIVYDTNPLQVHWYGHFMGYTGFSRLNRAMLFGLNRLGVQIKPDIEPYLNHVNADTRRAIERLSRINIPDNALKVYGTTVPVDYRHPGRKIVYTMMETSESAHHDYIGKLNMMSEVWVPTRYGKRILESNGIKVPVKVMPLGVDTTRYKPMLKPMEFGFEMNTFKFVSVFRWSYRKGFDILLRAYMEEFSSDEDVSLLIVSRIMDKPEEFGSQQIIDDFNGIKAGVHKENETLPHVVLYDKPIHEKHMPRLYNACHAFSMISRGEGFGLPYCFIKNTNIKTNSGYKYIQDIKLGDKVLTKNGRVKSVTEVHKNIVDCEFSTIRTKLNGRVDVTSNHAFLAVKKPNVTEYKRKGVSLCDYLSLTKPKWIRAEKLSEGDFLIYPIRKSWPKTKPYLLDITTFAHQDREIETVISPTDGIEKSYNRFSNGKFSNTQIAKMAGVSKRQVEHYKHDGKVSKMIKQKIEDTLSIILIEDQKSCTFRNIVFNKDLAKLFGYYCAEGNLLSKGNGVELHFHSNEIQYHEEVVMLMKKCFGVEPKVTKKGTRASIRTCNSLIADFMKFHCGNHAAHKKIPSIVLQSSKEIIISFLNGYINGDGHSSYTNNTLSISTASQELALAYRSLMMDMGEVCSLKQDNRKIYNCTIFGNPVVTDFEKDLRHKKDNKRWHVWSDLKYIYIPISNISRFYKKEEVFNFDVDLDHSYIAEIFIAHNCEASACGLPIIASNCSGQMDFLNEENSFLVEPEGYVEADKNGQLARMAKMCHFYQGQKFPNFGEASVQKTREHMRYVFENYQEARTKNQILKKNIEEHYTWDQAVERVYDRICQLSK